MGGTALGYESRRFDKEEFSLISKEIHDLFHELKMKTIISYRNKESFGDMDILVEKSSINIPNLILEKLGNVDHKFNSPYYSFSYKGIQIDFITVEREFFDCAYNFFIWGDLGNFIGRVARSLNFKYGIKGLEYQTWLDKHYKLEVSVSTDIKSILEFLGYDYERWLRGFDNEEDIFEFATSSRYFNSYYFSLEEQKHRDRTRNRKRKMYQKMIKYLEDNNITPKEKLSEDERNVHYDRAKETFGDDFEKEVEKQKTKYEKHLVIKNKFNGEIIRNITGLDGKELGQFKRELMNEHSNDEIYHASEDMIETWIRNHNKI